VYVSIQADRAQIQDGRRRTHHIRRYPYPAEHGAERPAPEQVVDGREGHDGAGDECVGEGE